MSDGVFWRVEFDLLRAPSRVGAAVHLAAPGTLEPRCRRPPREIERVGAAIFTARKFVSGSDYVTLCQPFTVEYSCGSCWMAVRAEAQRALAGA